MKRGILLAVAALASAAALLVVSLAVAGYSPWRGLVAFWDGSFGSWYSFASGTLVRTTPLVITGLATAIAFRGGVLNIGVEGQLLVGATCGAALALGTRMPAAIMIPATAVAGALGGVAWATIPAMLRRTRGVLEVISTLLLNSVAAYLLSWIVRAQLQEHTHTYPQSDLIPTAARLPLLLPGTRLHAGFAVAILAVVITWWMIAKSAWGFRLRAVGANPSAAATAGQINVPVVLTNALLVSGALAGLAGAIELQGVTYSLHEGISPGFGYTSIAVALLARLDARGILPSALLFAALESGAGAMQRDAGVPIVLVKCVEALLIIGVLIGEGIRRRSAATAPAAI